MVARFNACGKYPTWFTLIGAKFDATFSRGPFKETLLRQTVVGD
jgi:hypothetical protein